MSSDRFLASISLETPVVQAGMAGGVAGGDLAGAVSAAGGLGTVGMMAPAQFARALSKARKRAGGRPVAANLLVPFIRRAHLAALQDEATLVVIHGGLAPRWVARLRQRDITVFATVGSRAQALRALAVGVDGLVAQGAEAGGHVVGQEPLASLLPAVVELAEDKPVLAAGGIASAADVRRVLDLGAAAAVAGTRFLLTDESAAHDEYKRRVIEAQRTLTTLLFGMGWPLRHRVIPNAATERWCQADELGPTAARLLGVLSAPLTRLAPMGAMSSFASLQRASLPFFSPALPLAGMPERTVDCTALYAGETAARLRDVIPAAQAVAQLTP